MIQQPTVFVVDDDAASRDSVCAFAAAKGFPTQCFASGEEFLSLLCRHELPPGCLITDYKMDGMSGLELQERLSDQGSLLPVIVVSGHANVPVAVRAMLNGAVTVLEKPYTDDQLMTAIDQAISLNTQLRERGRQRAEIKRRYESLTPEERQVAKLLVNGAANKVVANKLVIGLRTVERRRHAALRKMHVETVPQLAQLLFQLNGPGAN